MKRQIKTIFIILVVLAVLQIVGGTIYLSFTAVDDKKYTTVECTIHSVVFTKTEDDEEEGTSGTIDKVIVTYQNEQGDTIEAELEDYPASFSIGSVFEGRYKDDPYKITLEETDWFTPSFMLAMGIAYAIGTSVLFAMRKRMGWYALDDGQDKHAEDVEEEIKENEEFSKQILDSSVVFGNKQDDNE